MSKVEAALTELLRLYDWRNELGQIERDPNHDKKQMKASLNKYGREKKQAWAAAREALAAASRRPGGNPPPTFAKPPPPPNPPLPYDGVLIHKSNTVGASGGGLSEQIKRAVAWYESLSPVDKALHDSDQRRSYVRGETGRDPGDVLADEVRRLRDLLTPADARDLLEAIAFGSGFISDQLDVKLQNIARSEGGGT